ncbi:hypothetical protein FRX31_020341 [Thalictrum thalictroides]|uniref:Uncharacterized protein n=1 Tax=Thalictrum thalictroides TaxID=46969 RepID=A0A7J6W182_THATH|nr:hypothetical protein FRX31_020341 [Thalictrum thalictroides]
MDSVMGPRKSKGVSSSKQRQKSAQWGKKPNVPGPTSSNNYRPCNLPCLKPKWQQVVTWAKYGGNCKVIEKEATKPIETVPRKGPIT